MAPLWPRQGIPRLGPRLARKKASKQESKQDFENKVLFSVAGAPARPSSLFSSLNGLEREPETFLTTGGAPLRLVVELRVGVEGRLTALSMLIRS